MKNKIFFLFFMMAGFLISEVDYTIIIDRNIFAPQKNEIKKEIKFPEVVKKFISPEIDKILNLVGTVTFEENIEKNVAIIENIRNKKMNFYKVGDLIEGLKIIEIYEKEVIFEYQGEKYSLSNAGCECLTIPENAIVFNIKMRALFEMMDTRSDIIENIKIKKIKKEGRLIGFQIDGIEEGTFLEEFGFQNGDIITGINGQLPENEDEYIKLYEEILKGEVKRVEIKFIRDKKPLLYIYHFIP